MGRRSTGRRAPHRPRRRRSPHPRPPARAVQAEQLAGLGLLRRVDDHRDGLEASDAASYLGPLPRASSMSGPNRSSRHGHESSVRWCGVNAPGDGSRPRAGGRCGGARERGLACVMGTSGRDAGAEARPARARQDGRNASTEQPRQTTPTSAAGRASPGRRFTFSGVEERGVDVAGAGEEAESSPCRGRATRASAAGETLGLAARGRCRRRCRAR